MSLEEKPKHCFDNAAINQMSKGIIDLSKPHLKQTSDLLNKLCIRQETILAEIQQENTRISNFVQNNELSEIFTLLNCYRDKLVSIKKRMQSIHSRNATLKKRALRLLNQKEKEALIRVQKREREQALIGSNNNA